MLKIFQPSPMHLSHYKHTYALVRVCVFLGGGDFCVVRERFFREYTTTTTCIITASFFTFFTLFFLLLFFLIVAFIARKERSKLAHFFFWGRGRN